MRGGQDARAALFRVLGEVRFEALRSSYTALKIRSGRLSNPEVALLGDLVRPGEVAIDVGANYGIYSFHLARHVGEAGRVIAFEAAPRTAVALRRILSALGVTDVVEVRDQAVGDSAGRVRLVTPRHADGSLRSGLAWTVPQSGQPAAVEAVEVPRVTLDEVAHDVGEIVFLKVDVEGADLCVLRGATRIIERDAPSILVEVSPPLLARQGLRPSDVAEFLDRHGYATYRYDPDSGRLRRQSVVTAEGDLLAVHGRRADRVRDRV